MGILIYFSESPLHFRKENCYFSFFFSSFYIFLAQQWENCADMSALAALRCAAVLILLPIIFGDHDGVLVDTSLGEAGATSVLWNDDKLFSSDYAFKNMAIKDGDYTNLAWISYGFPTESAPETVYIRLATPVTVSRFSFETKSGSSWDSNWTPWAPTKFELVGSADCENWTVLKSVEGENWTKKDERKEWNVQSDAFYKCLGIRTLQTKNNYVAIHDLKFYKGLTWSFILGSCIDSSDQDGWILLQQRNFSATSNDNNIFARVKWNNYRDGFEDPGIAYWYGLQKMHEKTSSGRWKVTLVFRGKAERCAVFNDFKVDGENEKFKLHVGDEVLQKGFGTNNNWRSYSLDSDNNMAFTTSDSDNDNYASYNCATLGGWLGGWWHPKSCADYCPNCKNDVVYDDINWITHTFMAMKRI